MSDVIVMSDGDVRTKPLSLEEMRVEWRAAQNEMIQMHVELAQIADALWPDEDSERPADLDVEGATGAQLVAGIRSLHELADRQARECCKLRARVNELETAPQLGLTALDAADVRRELETRELQLEDLAARSFLHKAPSARQALLARLGRVRQLLALLVVLVLAVLGGCADLDYPPPPYDVYLVDVPAEDVAIWEARIADWNAVVGEEVLVLHLEPPRGRCGVYVRAVPDTQWDAWTERAVCVTDVEYDIGEALCTAPHELGHVLGLPDDAAPFRSVMDRDYCTYIRPNHLNGAAVRARWGLEAVP